VEGGCLSEMSQGETNGVFTLMIFEISKHKTNEIVTGNILEILVKLESIDSFDNG